MKKIGIITSGGDCGGLNAVVKGAALMAHSRGMSCFIIPNGYAGLYNLVDFKSLVELNSERIDLVQANPAGSEAGHSRVKIEKIKDEKKYERIKAGLKKFSIDGLVISGGDDTGSVIVDLSEHGVPCVHAPKTMDLDLQTYSVGADSTINRIATFGQDLKTTGRTHNRIIVLEVFGRYAGHTAFRGGIAADADAILIPEIPANLDILYEHVKERFIRRILQSDVKAGTYLIVVAEGIKNENGEDLVDESAGLDTFGHKKLAGAGKYVSQQLTKRFKSDDSITDFMKNTKMYVPGLYERPEVREVRPGHLVRCGNSSAYDVNFGKEAGASAVLLLEKGVTGVTFARLSEGKIIYMKTEDAIKERSVSLYQVAIHESMGICFGRKSQKSDFAYTKATTHMNRYL